MKNDSNFGKELTDASGLQAIAWTLALWQNSCITTNSTFSWLLPSSSCTEIIRITCQGEFIEWLEVREATFFKITNLNWERSNDNFVLKGNAKEILSPFIRRKFCLENLTWECQNKFSAVTSRARQSLGQKWRLISDHYVWSREYVCSLCKIVTLHVLKYFSYSINRQISNRSSLCIDQVAERAWFWRRFDHKFFITGRHWLKSSTISEFILKSCVLVMAVVMCCYVTWNLSWTLAEESKHFSA